MKKVSVVVSTLQISFLHLCLEKNTFIAKMARSLVSTKYLVNKKKVFYKGKTN